MPGTCAIAEASAELSSEQSHTLTRRRRARPVQDHSWEPLQNLCRSADVGAEGIGADAVLAALAEADVQAACPPPFGEFADIIVEAGAGDVRTILQVVARTGADVKHLLPRSAS